MESSKNHLVSEDLHSSYANELDYLHEDDCSLLIIYATETGNAQDIAERIARETQRLGFPFRIASVDEYPLEDLIHESFVLFIISTTGSGKEPRSMTPLWSLLLRSDLPHDLFANLHYSVFGLGDSAYEKFCWAAKVLSRRLESLSAVEVYKRGDGDEQSAFGIEDAFRPWLSGVFTALDMFFPGLRSSQTIATSFSSRIRILDLADIRIPVATTIHRGSLKAVARRNQRITASDWMQDVRHIEFDLLDDDALRYNPGDVAVIYPVAPADDVSLFLERMSWSDEADNAFGFEHVTNALPLPKDIPTATTLRAIFTYWLDINAVPRLSFFEALRQFAQDDMEREKLEEFCSPEGADELYEYCFRVRRTILEVLTEFRSLNIPKEFIFDVFPPLRPRQFSIASSIEVYPKQVHLCVAIVKYKTKLKVPRRGVCSTYLASIQPGDTLSIGIEQGSLNMPQNPETPVICVGPGTGVAPMRALVGSRIRNGHYENTLYFGCRHASKDQHYGLEWASYAQSGSLTYRAAFSRDGPEGQARIYVQDLMKEDKERIWELVGTKGAMVYISGSANKMPAAVKATIVDAAMAIGGMAEDEAKSFLKRMQMAGRIWEECWS